MKYFTTPIVMSMLKPLVFHHQKSEIGAVCLDEYGRSAPIGALIQNENELDGYAHKALAINHITEEQLMNAASSGIYPFSICRWWNALPKEHGIALLR